MSHVSAGSESFESQFCQTDDTFTIWANEVPALYGLFGLDDVPSGPLVDVVKESQRLPEWLFNKVSLTDWFNNKVQKHFGNVEITKLSNDRETLSS